MRTIAAFLKSRTRQPTKDVFGNKSSKAKGMPEPIFTIPKPNELPWLSPWQMYAMVHVDLWDSIEFLMTKLEPVHLEDLDLDERDCVICQEEFRISEDPKLSHTPVKTVCGHVFGKPCIIKWLDPLCFWGLTEGREPEIDYMDPSTVEEAQTTCPTCRRLFFDKPAREPLDSLASRLWLWDKAYAYAGVARGRTEEHCRRILWEYIEYCRSINEFKISRELGLELSRRSEILLAQFAVRIGGIYLDEVRERLRVKLLALGNYNLRDSVFAYIDDIDFADLFQRKDYPDQGHGDVKDEHYGYDYEAKEDKDEENEVKDEVEEGRVEDKAGEEEGQVEDKVEDKVEDEEANHRHPEGSCCIL